MNCIVRSHLLGSVLVGAIGISACSNSTDKSSGIGGTGGTGGKTGVNGGAANGGNSDTGIGGVANAGQIGTGGSADLTTAGAPGTGGGVSAAGNVGAAGASKAGAPGTGGGVGAAGNVGAAGASKAGASGSGGGVGAAGNSGVAGASKAGASGSGGGVGAGGNVGTAGSNGSNAIVRWTFDTLDGWTIKPADSFIPLRIDAAVGTTFTATAGIATLTVPFGASSNTALQTTAVQRGISPALNMTGLTLTLRIRWVSGGVGIAASEGGFDVYIIPSDGDWTEGFAGRGEFTLVDRGATAFKQFTYTIPAADATWDPSSIQQLQIRIDSKYWEGPTFDYTKAVFEIDSISY